jgi:type I restriction enzyme, S subunit
LSIRVDLPVGWRWQRIGDIATVVGGGTPSTRVAANFDGGIPWVTPRDLSAHEDRSVVCGARTLSRQGLNSSAAKLLPAGAVLVSSRAPVGYVALAANALATNQGIRSLVLKDGYCPDYFHYVLRVMRPVLESRANGSTFAELSGAELKEIVVPVPPTTVQRQIAAVLNAVDDKASIKRLIARKSVRMAELVYHQFAAQAERRTLCSLGDVAIVSGGATPSTKRTEYWGGGYAWATPSDLTSLVHPFLYSTQRTISDEGLASCRARLHPKGSILLSSRATIGHATLTEVECATNQGVLAVTPLDDQLRFALFHELRGRERQLLALSSGSTFPELARSTLRELQVRIPRDPGLADLHARLSALHRGAIAAASVERAASRLRDRLIPSLVFGQIPSAPLAALADAATWSAAA